MTTKERIIAEYNNVKLIQVHPSFAAISKKCRVSKAYAWQVVKDYLKQKCL